YGETVDVAAGHGTYRKRKLTVSLYLPCWISSPAIFRPAPDVRVQGAYTLGERGRSRLQDDGRLDLVQFAAAHGGSVFESRARGHFLRAEFLSAPGSENDIGPARDDLGRIGVDAMLRQRLPCMLGEYVLAAGNLDQLRHPADAGDHRLVPFLEIHPRATRQ